MPAGENGMVLYKKSKKKTKKHKEKDQIKKQDTKSAGENEKDLEKEETANLKIPSSLETDEGTHTLLFLNIAWVTVVKRCW